MCDVVYCSVYDCDPVVPYLPEMINEHLQAGTDWD